MDLEGGRVVSINANMERVGEPPKGLDGWGPRHEMESQFMREQNPTITVWIQKYIWNKNSLQQLLWRRSSRGSPYYWPY